MYWAMFMYKHTRCNILDQTFLILGEWEHGFFSMTAVGATMVGAIKVNKKYSRQIS